ncbi:hypothetical protein AWM70_11465 [Paenibacillus yonginensis]|uniref:DUF3907 domain-containing protein n=1 Tax=Paenibacillus yonginensis TaxID=1462996 RepID=A0A1B1N132_9BACL|nr:DUF3907 family protein [Paenibacillus yonginensis]ANS75144.1 hypothetical protein AWM70_11465 [Paenibacillus yonginensis]
MHEANTRDLCESARNKLKTAAERIETFLNQYSLPQLAEEQDEESVRFYKGFLSDLRHLLVFSEANYEKLGVLLRRASFDKESGEKALYHVYHDCVNLFFYPKSESYAEDGRYAYTGQDAIRFRRKPASAARAVILDITRIFEELRDDLTYYESDYLTQLRMQKSGC